VFNRVAQRLGILTCGFVFAISIKPAVADEKLTAHNKDIVRDFYTTVLIGRDVDAAPKFLKADYIQHNPQVPTGLKGFMDTFRERFAQKLPPDYKRELLNVIGITTWSWSMFAKAGPERTASIIKHSGSTCSAFKTA
jgi:hypothetical protein